MKYTIGIGDCKEETWGANVSVSDQTGKEIVMIPFELGDGEDRERAIQLAMVIRDYLLTQYPG